MCESVLCVSVYMCMCECVYVPKGKDCIKSISSFPMKMISYLYYYIYQEVYNYYTFVEGVTMTSDEDESTAVIERASVMYMYIH